jgi:hypothetical protein
MKQLSDMHISIQELEKERDEVMNAIEVQLENVMINMLEDKSDIGSAVGVLQTPLGHINDINQSPSAWKRPSGTRPRRGTVVTFTSSIDDHTLRIPPEDSATAAVQTEVGSQRKSANTIASSHRDPLRRLDQQLTIKSEKMAEKMASIQRKVSTLIQLERFYRY